VFEKRIFGPKKDEVRGGLKKRCNEELHNMYYSPNKIPEGNRPLGKPRHLRPPTTLPYKEIIVLKSRKVKTGWPYTREMWQNFLRKVVSKKGRFGN
jgi:hypothetical protein